MSWRRVNGADDRDLADAKARIRRFIGLIHDAVDRGPAIHGNHRQSAHFNRRRPRGAFAAP